MEEEGLWIRPKESLLLDGSLPGESSEPGQLILTRRDEDGRPTVLIEPFAEWLCFRDVVGENEALAERDTRQQRQHRVELDPVLLNRVQNLTVLIRDNQRPVL
jgi:hypothetical protein